MPIVYYMEIDATLGFITVLTGYTFLSGDDKLVEKISCNSLALQRSRDSILGDRCLMILNANKKYFIEIEVNVTTKK